MLMLFKQKELLLKGFRILYILYCIFKADIQLYLLYNYNLYLITIQNAYQLHNMVKI